ncbi:hypothetical protein JEQ12_007873 [Ovis aries]|uniref:AT-rich interactive domain-containing protein 3 n=2 Tax=Ovis aries TaxID=9940 RepID=A0A835ZWX2_SHEEP|nr:hypothetical protein JEQ12_007873 [Ovis aries]
MPGGFLFEGLSDDEDDFHPSARPTPSSSTPSSRPASLGYSGAAGPRPITQSELATALALASTPESSSHTPTPGTQGHSSGTSPMSSSVQSGMPITNDLFSQALQHALQALGQPSLQAFKQKSKLQTDKTQPNDVKNRPCTTCEKVQQVRSHASLWVKLEAVMEPLHPQQKQPPPPQPPHLAPLQMDAREKQGQQMRETPFLYTQKLVTQQTHLSATPGRPSGSPALGPSARVPPATAGARVFEQSKVNSEPEEEEGGLEGEDGDDEVAEVPEKQTQAASKYFHVQKVARQDPRAAPLTGLLPAPGLAPHGQQAKEDHTKDASKTSASVSAAGQPGWNLDEQLKQNGGLAWSDDADGGRGREISRDFAKLYELDSDPERKEFLDDLFVFMQKRGTPINRIPIMAKQILDLYMLYKLVTEKGGLVEIINKKIWREITKGLNLPTSITSAAFTLRTQYMKYLYAYECEKKALSSPAELQAAIDGNRREGRRPSYSSSLFGYSPTAAAGAPALLSPPKIRFPILGLGSSGGTSASGSRMSPAAPLRKGDGVPVTTVPVPNRLAVPVTLAGQQASTRTATLEQLRERLESGEPPEKKVSRLSEEEQRLVQQAFQRNLFNMARQLPMKIRINGREDRAEASAAALNLTTSSVGSISMSVDIDGTTYAGVLFAQKPAVHLITGSAPQSLGSSSSSSSSSHCSPSPTSSRGTPSAEPSTSWSL